ncbi:hypothetical protein [Loktanella sp. R86503]|uniref:hypothetical protein n=1 Tax=Loktanella sp. R86503 TaxID=3093847 RepID=UPI0036DADAE0
MIRHSLTALVAVAVLLSPIAAAAKQAPQPSQHRQLAQQHQPARAAAPRHVPAPAPVPKVAPHQTPNQNAKADVLVPAALAVLLAGALAQN